MPFAVLKICLTHLKPAGIRTFELILAWHAGLRHQQSADWSYQQAAASEKDRPQTLVVLPRNSARAAIIAYCGLGAEIVVVVTLGAKFMARTQASPRDGQEKTRASESRTAYCSSGRW